jgi:hypothetical protein
MFFISVKHIIAKIYSQWQDLFAPGMSLNIITNKDFIITLKSSQDHLSNIN